MTDLKVFEGAVDWVIAKDLEDVAKVLEEHTGYEPEEYELEDFVEVDMDKEFNLIFVDYGLDFRPSESEYPKGATVYFDEEGSGYWVATATYQQWTDHMGRAFLGSTEW